MKIKRITMITLLATCLSACTNNEEISKNELEIKPNYVGEYTKHYVNIFGGVVNGNTMRQATGNVFIKDFLRSGERAIEVYPGSSYSPDFPDLPKGYYAEVLFEEVNRHAEKPKELYSGTATSKIQAIVKIPNKSDAYFRYTLKIYDEKGEFKDVRYDPLFTTFEDYNFVFNVRKPVYDQDEKITLNIENWGPNYVSFSNNWKLFRQKGDEWEQVTGFIIENKITAEPGIIPSAWNMDYLDINRDSGLLGSGISVSINLNHIKLEKGFYKIQGTMGSAKHVFTVEDSFEVK